MVAFRTGDPGWLRLRPPLMALSADEQSALRDKLFAIGATVRDFPQ